MVTELQIEGAMKGQMMWMSIFITAFVAYVINLAAFFNLLDGSYIFGAPYWLYISSAYSDFLIYC